MCKILKWPNGKQVSCLFLCMLIGLSSHSVMAFKPAPKPRHFVREDYPTWPPQPDDRIVFPWFFRYLNVKDDRNRAEMTIPVPPPQYDVEAGGGVGRDGSFSLGIRRPRRLKEAWFWDGKPFSGKSPPRRQIDWKRIGVNYPKVNVGDVVPIFQQYYRVQKVAHNQVVGNDYDYDYDKLSGDGSVAKRSLITFEKVKPSSLPKGLSIQPASIVIPLKGYAYTRNSLFLPSKYWNKIVRFNVEGITPRTKTSSAYVSMKMSFNEKVPTRWSKGPRRKVISTESVTRSKKFKSAKVGDRLEFANITAVNSRGRP